MSETSKLAEKHRRVTPEPLPAMRRYPALVVLPIALLLLASVGALQLRTPIYASEARVIVGRVDVNAYAMSGAVQANRDLATAYARVGPLPVVRELMPEGLRSARYVTTPIPESPMIRIRATDVKQSRATEVAQAATDALMKYVAESNNNSTELAELLNDYQQAQEELTIALEARRAMPATAPIAEMRKADATIAAKQLQSDTTNKVYQERRTKVNGFGDLTLVSMARPLGSDQKTTAQTLAAASATVGTLLGVVLATSFDYFRRRRSSRVAHVVAPETP